MRSQRRLFTSLALAPVVAAVGAIHGYLALVTAGAWVGTARRSRHADAVSSPEPATGSATTPMTTSTRFVVLVPAHDEAALIESTVHGVRSIDYPAERFEVHVVADHCTDATADLARAAGATVHEHERPDARGKGAALRWTIERLRAGLADDDVVVIVDADTVVDPGFLRGLDAEFQAGNQVVQGYYGVRDETATPSTAFRAAALAVRHHLRPLGRTTLGASSGLYGNGMGFRAAVLDARPLSDHLTEDLELQLDLVLDGVPIGYAPDAVVRAEMPTTLEASRTQHERWERGRIDLARRYVPRLISSVGSPGARRTRARLDAAADQLVPPFTVLAAFTLATAIVATVRGRWRANGLDRSLGRVARWCLAVQAVHVGSALVMVRAPWAVYRALLGAPVMVWWKLRLWIRMLTSGDTVEWERTARNEPSAGEPAGGGGVAR